MTVRKKNIDNFFFEFLNSKIHIGVHEDIVKNESGVKQMYLDAPTTIYKLGSFQLTCYEGILTSISCNFRYEENISAFSSIWNHIKTIDNCLHFFKTHGSEITINKAFTFDDQLALRLNNGLNLIYDITNYNGSSHLVLIEING